MPVVELTKKQKRLLEVVVDRYRQSESAVRGKDIADAVNRNPGTIRSQMQSLKALQLIEGIPGPKGGYEPTGAAYDALQIDDMDKSSEVPVKRNGEQVGNEYILEIDLINVHHPKNCRAEIDFYENDIQYKEGDTLVIGPTPVSRLMIKGTVIEKDNAKTSNIIAIEDMIAPIDETEHKSLTIS